MGRRVAEDDSLKVILTGAVDIKAGDWIVANGVLGMALESIKLEASESGAIAIESDKGIYETDQIGEENFQAIGSKIYWNNENKIFTLLDKIDKEDPDPDVPNTLVGVLTDVIKDEEEVIKAIQFYYFPTIV